MTKQKVSIDHRTNKCVIKVGKNIETSEQVNTLFMMKLYKI